MSIPAKGYRIVWADKDEEQDELHADFKLSASGETIMLSAPDLTVIDTVSFGGQTADISLARFPNGTGDFTEMSPTFEAENTLVSGDLDGDGDSDGADLAVPCAELGRTDCTGDCLGDLNTDGRVDDTDLLDFASGFGRK